MFQSHIQISNMRYQIKALTESFKFYSKSSDDWYKFTLTKLPTDWTQEQFEARQELRSELFGEMEAGMIAARGAHDAYMKEESRLNQMGRMKRNGF